MEDAWRPNNLLTGWIFLEYHKMTPPQWTSKASLKYLYVAAPIVLRFSLCENHCRASVLHLVIVYEAHAKAGESICAKFATVFKLGSIPLSNVKTLPVFRRSMLLYMLVNPSFNAAPFKALQLLRSWLLIKYSKASSSHSTLLKTELIILTLKYGIMAFIRFCPWPVLNSYSIVMCKVTNCMKPRRADFVYFLSFSMASDSSAFAKKF